MLSDTYLGTNQLFYQFRNTPYGNNKALESLTFNLISSSMEIFNIEFDVPLCSDK